MTTTTQRKRRAVVVVLSALALAACSDKITGTTVQSVPTSGDAVAVQRLFSVEDCTIYRFFDLGYPRYFAKCGAQVSTLERH